MNQFEPDDYSPDSSGEMPAATVKEFEAAEPCNDNDETDDGPKAA